MIKTEQKLSSKNTSINKNQAPIIVKEVAKRVGWIPGSKNLDLGGGRYDILTEKLHDEHSVTNLIYDPFNRSEEHNKQILQSLEEEKADTVTISNVLNVVQEIDERINIIKNAHNYLKDGGSAFITVYEGNKSNIGKETKKDQFQLNKPMQDYIEEVSQVFEHAEIKGKLIICKK